MTTYPLAPNGIFRTVQGEGALLGVPMAFVRLGGCSVACPQCDTDYRVSRRATADEIATEVKALGLPWAWITGGEPADHDLTELVDALRLFCHAALATSGHKPLAARVDFLSVSPHGKPSDLLLRFGHQINLVPGLNGLKLEDWSDYKAHFAYRYVTPFWYGPADRAERIAECAAFVQAHPDWRLGVQAHKVLGLP